MVRLTLNLRNKYVFFAGSAITFLYLIYHITIIVDSIDITKMDVLLYYVLTIMTTTLFWIPYNYISDLDYNVGSDQPLSEVIVEYIATFLNTMKKNLKL